MSDLVLSFETLIDVTYLFTFINLLWCVTSVPAAPAACDSPAGRTFLIGRELGKRFLVLWCVVTESLGNTPGDLHFQLVVMAFLICCGFSDV